MISVEADRAGVAFEVTEHEVHLLPEESALEHLPSELDDVVVLPLTVYLLIVEDELRVVEKVGRELHGEVDGFAVLESEAFPERSDIESLFFRHFDFERISVGTHTELLEGHEM